MASALASALTIGVACLPDLESTPITTGSESGVCGNGFIDYNSGEQCDPGIPDASVPGCTRTCQIDCDAGGLPAFIDNSSNHCYFLLPEEAGTADSASSCAAYGAHVITFGNGAEVNNVSGQLTPQPKAQEFWLGLGPTPPHDGGEPTYSSSIDEPGFAHPGLCKGCYEPVLEKNGTLPLRSSASKDAGCVTWLLRAAPARWYATNCDSKFPTICEREPVGKPSPCNDLVCFSVPARPSKEYKWDPASLTAPMTAAAAAAFCAQLGDAGTGSLAVFETPEEREQVFYALMQLPEDSRPTDFWIGLVASGPDGGHIKWVWDNGKPEDSYPAPWGDHQPAATLPGLRAFSRQTGTAYGQQATTYDTQLARAEDPDAGDGGTPLHAVLCQLTH
jgi:hypothetical protein